jgi:hypothetical protein
MMHLMKLFFARKHKEPRKTLACQVSSLSDPISLDCRSTRGRDRFTVTNEIMTPLSISFITTHYLDAGEIVDMRVTPFKECREYRLRGRVVSCRPRKSTEKINFEGVIEFLSTKSLQQECLNVCFSNRTILSCS